MTNMWKFLVACEFLFFNFVFKLEPLDGLPLADPGIRRTAMKYEHLTFECRMEVLMSL